MYSFAGKTVCPVLPLFSTVQVFCCFPYKTQYFGGKQVMRTRKEIISSFYSQIDENLRLEKSRHGQLEYHTTMAYIHRYTSNHSKVLEVGAGTGR